MAEEQQVKEKQKKKKEYFYFVDNVKYETDQPTVTGALIKAKILNFDASYGLLLEGVGAESDQQINDDTVVSLEKEHGPLRFYTVPPATFGGHDAT